MKIWNRSRGCWPLRRVCNPKPDPVTGAFTAVKYDEETGQPLAGAGYTLYQNGAPAASAVSDGTGSISFTGLAPGEYTLTETQTPEGYLPERTSHQVIVAEDGRVLIDGRPAEAFPTGKFPLYDVPVHEAEITFEKVDGDTGQPLADAVFSLPNGVVAISGSDGKVDFGTFGPGTYTIHEVTAPEGYSAVQEDYTVEVTTDGKVLIDGTPIEDFTAENKKLPAPSQRPVINSVEEGDQVVMGTGVPGAEIAVTLPDGSVITTTVPADGSWSVALPEGTRLQAGQTIHAVQTEPGRSPSEAASFEVQTRA